jgi:outer membrane protein OmpA-like peptidoglycan-associated protein
MISTYPYSKIKIRKMKKLSILIFLVSVCLKPFAQNFPGYRSGNYTGVNGVFFNPANIADSRYRWDVNLFGVHAGISNNNASFKLKNLDDAFNDNKVDSLLFGASNKITNGAVNVDFFGPSFMFNVNKKTSIALTSRVRAVANVMNIDGNFIQSINNDFNGTLPFTINSDKNQKIAINGWTDLGVSLGQVLVDNGKHFLKGGITFKYLAGSGNAYTNIGKLKATVDEDLAGNIYLANATGSVGIGYAGMDFENFEANDAFKFNGHGVGGDIGFVYEYRPDADHLTERYQNKYKLKLGLALLDVGSLKYKPKPAENGNYTINVSGIQQWHPEDIDGKSISEIKTYLDGSPYFTNNAANLSSYTVSLPTNLQVNADYAFTKSVYLELAGQINLAKKDNNYNSFYHNTVALTPRWETGHFGIYLPLSYNEVSKFNAGISFRLGPVFFGSGSVFTALFDKSKQADVHFGINFGGLFKKPRLKKESVVTPPPAVEKPVTDTDHDGINDNEDKCPDTPGVAKYNGCPIPDTDGDGINDEEDKCPSAAGIAKYSGCPIPDTDNDGVNDEEDKCPTIAGVAKYNGCPVPDTDGDGINDEGDKCPSLAGIAANNGCPAIKEEVVKKMAYAAKQIYFATGKATLLSKSFPALNEVAKILKTTPDTRLQIEGYTDNTGKSETNLILSDKRALAVKNYLVSKGVEENRIGYKGYGQQNPVADNKTATGRAKNRRVELKLGY